MFRFFIFMCVIALTAFFSPLADDAIAATSYSSGCYVDNQYETGTLTVPGATSITVHIWGSTEEGYDFINVDGVYYQGAFDSTYTKAGNSVAYEFSADYINSCGDGAGEGASITIAAAGGGGGADATAPTVTAFTMPASSTNKTVSVSSFTASDNVGVTGYMINQSGIRPAAGDAGWSASAPTSFTFSSNPATVAAYAWVKDAAGNVSTATVSANVNLIDATSPTVTAFAMPAMSTGVAVSVTTFTATDDFAVGGYQITESSTAPAYAAGGWTASAPTTYTFSGGAGTKTLYAWAKDNSNHVSTSLSASLTLDLASPTITSFAMPATASSTTVSVTSFSATDDIGVTGYLITETSSTPAVGAAGWTGTAPASFTFSGTGVKTAYAWVKDAAGRIVSASTNVTISVDATPPVTTASPAAGSYYNSASVTLSCSDGAGSGCNKTYYTTDGTAPTTSSAQYSGAIAVNASKTIKYFSTDVAGNSEAVKSTAYTILVDVTAPTTTASPASGSFYNSASVTLSCSDGAGSGCNKIYYTTDGTVPTTSSTQYSGAIAVNTSKTIKYFSTDLAGNSEAVKSTAYTIVVDVTAPTTTISPAAGSYYNSVSVTLSCSDGAGSGCNKTYYTTDGSVPTTSSAQYSGAIVVNASKTIKYFSTDVAGNSEAVKSTAYTIVIDVTAPTTTISPAAGSFYNSASVTLSCSDGAGAGCDKIYYTTDGSAPTTSSTQYSGAIAVNASKTIKYFSTDLAGNSEAVKSTAYTIIVDVTAPTTTALPVAGNYNNSASVTLSCSDGAGSGCNKTYYTTDGTNPTTSSAQYSGAILVTSTKTVKYFSTDLAGNSEAVKSTAYTIVDTISPVTTASPAGGTYSSSQSVTLTASETATIYYTLDGSTPTTSSSVYAAPLTIGSTTTLKFFAKDTAGNSEIVKAQTYTMCGGGGSDITFSGANIDLGACNGAYIKTITATTPTNLRICSDQGYCGNLTVSGGTVSGQIDISGIACTASGSTITCGAESLVFSGGALTFDLSGMLGMDIYRVLVSGGALKFDSAFMDDEGYCSTGYQGSLAVGSAIPVWTVNLLTSPLDIALDGSGGIYVVDYNGQTVNKFTTASTTPAWTASTVVGNPYSVAVDGSGGIYVANYGSNTLKKFTTASTTPVWTANTGVSPRKVAVDGSGVYVANYVSNTVQKFGAGVSVWTGNTGSGPSSVALDGIGGIYVVNSASNTVQKFTTASSSPIWTGNTGAMPYSVAYDGSGGIYVANYGNNTVQKFTTASSSPIWTGNTGLKPSSVALDGSGGIYVASEESGLVQKFTTASATPVWTGDAGKAPTSVAVDASGAVFVVARQTRGVQKFTLASSGGACGDTSAPTTSAYPPAGAYSAAQTISLFTDEPATIYYTTDGSTPTTGSSVYAAPIAVSSTTTIKYFAKDTAGNQEAVKSGAYVIDATAPTTTAAPAAGSYFNSTSVTLACSDTGGAGCSKTYYTTDGSNPTTSSTQYSGAIAVNASKTIKYFSTDLAGNSEAVKSTAYTIVVDVAAPTTTASPAAGTYYAAQSVTLSCLDSGPAGCDKIYYTTDGSVPTTSSTQYSGAIAVNVSKTIKYFSTDLAGNQEAYKTALYTIDTSLPVVSASPAGGAYSSTQTVTLSATKSATIYYTLDGSNPTTGSQVYTVPLSIAASKTVKFFGRDSGANQSAVTTETYVIDAIAPTTTANPAGNTYYTTKSVTLSCADTGGAGCDKTYYTLDGSNPTTSSTQYSGAISVLTSKTLKFFSKDLAGNSEGIKTETYTIDLNPPVTTASPAGGTFGSPQSIALSTTKSATIYYTTNGTVPTTSSTVYTVPIAVNSTTTLKFFAQDSGSNTESVKTETYTISDTTPPVTMATPPGGTYASIQTVALATNELATTIYYTLDGSTPTTSSTVYSGPISVSIPKTLKFFAKDYAGNVEDVKTQSYSSCGSGGGGGSVSFAGSLADLGYCGAEYYEKITATTPTTLEFCSNLNNCSTITISGATASGSIHVAGTTCTTSGSTITCDGENLTFTTPVQFIQNGFQNGGAYSATVSNGVMTVNATIYDSEWDECDDLSPGIFALGSAIPVLSAQSGTNPSSIVVDNGGNVYVAYNETKVRKLDSSLAAVWTGNTGAFSPTDIAIDNSGGIYAPTGAGNTVLKFTTGSATPVWTGNTEFGGQPNAVAVDGSGGIYTANYGRNHVQKFTTGSSTPIWTGDTGAASNPIDVAVDGSGGVYVTNYGTSTAQKFTTSSTTPVWTGSTAVSPNSIAVDGTGGIYVVNFAANAQKFTTASAMPVWTGNTGGSPKSVALDGSGGIYLVSTLDHTVQKFTTASPWPVWTGAAFNSPSSVAVDSSGNVYVTATGNSNILKFTPEASGGACSDTTAPSTTVYPPAGAYNTTKTVTLITDEPATIYYTVDGTLPTAASPVYAGPIAVNSTTTVKYFAKDASGNTEAVKSSQYIIDMIAPTVSASPAGGNYNATQTVTLSCNDTGGAGCDKIYYTTNGTTPTTSSSVYSGQLSITDTTTLKYFATDKATNQSGVGTQVYTIDRFAPSTTATPPAGAYSTMVSVVLSCSDTGGSGCGNTYYTTDGSTPTTGSPVYAGPISINVPTVLKYFSKDLAGNTETVRTGTYLITSNPGFGGGGSGQCSGNSVASVEATDPHTLTIYGWPHTALGTISIPNTTVSGSWTVPSQGASISCTTTGDSKLTCGVGTIDFGAGMSVNDGVSTTFTVNRFNALNVKNASVLDFFDSDCGTFANHIYVSFGQSTIRTTATPSGGTYATPQTVTLSANMTATIYYTLDGTTPTKSSPVYTAPLLISTDTQLKFFGEDWFHNQEPVNTENYIISSGAPRSWTSPGPGYYQTPQTVSINTDRAATVRYTTDGSAPTGASSVYATPIAVNGNMTIKYYADDGSGHLETAHSDSYVIDAVAPVTSIAPAPGPYWTPKVVTLSVNEPATTYYTTDGTVPTTASSIYTAPLMISDTTTVKYFSVDLAGNTEVAHTAVYTINNPAYSCGAPATAWSTQSSGVNDHEVLNSATIGSDGYLYLVSTVTAPGSGDPGWRIDKRDLATGNVVWSVTSNPTSGNDHAVKIAYGSDGYLYIAGGQDRKYSATYADNYETWRIEKRATADGALVWAQTEDATGSLQAMAVGLNELYLAGKNHDAGMNDEALTSTWAVVEIRSLANGAITARDNNLSFHNGRGGVGQIVGLAVGADGWYMAGQFLGGNWDIQKSELQTLDPLWRQSATIAGNGGQLSAIDVDPTGVFTAGMVYEQGGGLYSSHRMQRLSPATGAVVWQQDENPVLNAWDTFLDVKAGPDAIYYSGYDAAPGSYQMRLERRGRENGGLISVSQNDLSGGTDFYSGVIIAPDGYVVIGNDAHAVSGGLHDTSDIVKYNCGVTPICTNPQAATTWSSSPVITPNQTTIKRGDVDELRLKINNLRENANITACSWSDAILTVNTTPIRKPHFDEMRQCLSEVYSKCGFTPPSFTDPVLTENATPVRGVHVEEIRNAIKAAP